MARRKLYSDTEDVLTAARKRVAYIFDAYDSVVVCFSGGKDSLVTLHLVRQEAERRGKKVEALFRDEELIPNSVISFVDGYRQQDWLNLRWYCVPLKSSKFLLGRVIEYVQWDRNREHMRPIPEYAITLPPDDNRVFDQYTMDTFSAAPYPGKVAFVTGMRAAESILRYQASISALNLPFIHTSNDRRVSLCWPIYDWQENDVFKFFHENGIAYCPTYDAQMWAGQGLRVATPLQAANAKKLDQIKASEPEFFARLMQVFPEMRVQERYWKDLDRNHVKRQYGATWEGLEQYIDDFIPDAAEQGIVRERLRKIKLLRDRRESAYPLDYVFNWLASGGCKRNLIPLPQEYHK